MAVNLTDKKIWSNGDSIMAPTDSWMTQFATATGATLTNRAGGGKGLVPYAGSYATFAEVPDNSNNTYAYAFINLAVNDIWRRYEWFIYAAAMEAYLNHMINVKGWQPTQIVYATPYYLPISSLPADGAYAPYVFNEYIREIKRICGIYGVICADLYGYGETLTPEQKAAFAEQHPYPAGHEIIRDFYLNTLSYTPAPAVVVDPKQRRNAYSFTPTSNIALAGTGVNAANVYVIFESANPLNNYVPGRGTNSFTTLQAGIRYTVVPMIKQVLNLNTLGLPDPEPGLSSYSGASEAAAYVTASGRSGITSALANFIKGLKQNNLWDRCLGFWILDGDFNKAKFNIKNPVDTDAAGRLTQVGGTFTAAGWTSSNTSVLKTNLKPINYGRGFLMYGGTTVTGIEEKNDFGTDGAYTFFRATDSLNRAWGQVGHNTLYPVWIDKAVARRFYLKGDATHGSTFVNGLSVNKWTNINADLDNGQFVIGNAQGLTSGTTRTYRSAGLFTMLDEQEINKLDKQIETFEAALAGGVSYLTALDLPLLGPNDPLPAAYVNAVVEKINEYITLVNPEAVIAN